MQDFCVADPALVAASLDTQCVHVWLLPYCRASGRDALRGLLAAYSGCNPEQLYITSGPHGRPQLSGEYAWLDFNFSHSGGFALAAIARDLPELGVDLEVSRLRSNPLDLSKRFFAPAEHAQLATLPEARREQAFLRLWTAKEAVLKGLGRGLAYGLHKVAFDLDGDVLQAACFIGPAAPARNWIVHSRSTERSCMCVAWRGAQRSLRFLRSEGAELSRAS